MSSHSLEQFTFPSEELIFTEVLALEISAGEQSPHWHPANARQAHFPIHRGPSFTFAVR